MKPAEALYFEGKPSISTKTKAFGYSSFAICVDVEESLISNIWLITGFDLTPSQFEIALNTLYEIGETYDLLLVDWNSLDLVDLKNYNKVRAYLRDFLSTE